MFIISQTPEAVQTLEELEMEWIPVVRVNVINNALTTVLTAIAGIVFFKELWSLPLAMGIVLCIVGSVLITGGLLLLAYSGYVIWQVVPGLNVSASWAVQGANVSAVVGIAGVAMLAFGLLLALRQITAAPLSRLGLIGAPPAPPKR